MKIIKFVNNAFSTKMLQSDLAIAQVTISENEFMNEAHKDDVTSVIGHPDTAKLFGLKENRQSLTLKSGDTLFVCEMNNQTKTRLPEGITRMSEIPDGFTFRFLKIKVFDIPSDILKEMK